MPSNELPLEELMNYKGSSVCPEDFDDYWGGALKEMHAVDPNVELRPADFVTDAADCFDLFFTGVRGARIHAKLLLPKGLQSPCPAVLQFHGYTGNAGNWCEKLSYVCAGFAVAALDCRGQAGLSQDTGGVQGTTMNGHIIRGLLDEPENLLMRHIFLDTAELAEIVMGLPSVDETRVSVMGGSQGGGLSLVCAALVPQIKKAAVDYPFLCDYQRVWQLNRTIENAYSELRTFFRDFDPRHEREDEFFRRLGYIDAVNLAKWIRADTIMAITLMDECCPPSTQFATFNRIPGKKHKYIYPDFTHECIPSHADIVYQFITKEQ